MGFSTDKKTPAETGLGDLESGDIVDVESDVEKYQTPWRYSSPLVQVLITSIAAFGCPGMFNALTGLGGGGQVNTETTAKGNMALYAVSSVIYLFVAPIVYHYCGPRWTMFMGGLFYPLYGGSLLAYNYIQSDAFIISTSALLGIGATFFWVGQGSVMTGAPMPIEKGRMVGIFWFIFNMGGVIGDFISMGINWSATTQGVSTGTYAAFIALMGCGWLSTLVLANPNRIIRSNGSRMRDHDQEVRPNVVKDFIAILKILPRKETIVMIPYFLMSNWFYSYQQNTVNARLFDIRTRSFNGAMYWFAQMVASPLFGLWLDNKRLSRKRRGIMGYLFVCIFSLILWGGGLALQLRSAPSEDSTGKYYYATAALDMIDSHTKYAGPFVLYFFYGAFDAVWQTMAYWLIGCVGAGADDTENEDELLSRYVGLYKSLQSAGAAIAWKINNMGTNYDTEFAINWGILSGALILLAPFFWFMKDSGLEESMEIEDDKGIVHTVPSDSKSF